MTASDGTVPRIDPTDHAPEWITASVCTPTGETRYRRAGCGRPTLVLLRDDSPAAGARCDLLARAGRTWVVRPPASLDGEGALDWLIDVIDALGLDHVHLVADDAWLPLAFAARTSSPLRCRSVTGLVPDGDRAIP